MKTHKWADIKRKSQENLECPKCEGIHDHQDDWHPTARCPKCGGDMVTVAPLPDLKGYGHGV